MSDGLFPTIVSKDRNGNAVANPIYIQIVDGSSGNALVSGDTAYSSGAAGLPNWVAVRSDGGGALVADGNWSPLSVNASGQLRVDASVTASVDFSYVDDSAEFTIGASKVGAVGFLYNSGADNVDDGDIGIPRMTVDRRILTADNWDDDTPHSSGQTGSFVLGVRSDASGSLVDADGDYTPFSIDAGGKLRVIHEDTLNVTVTNTVDTNVVNTAQTSPLWVQTGYTQLGNEVNQYQESVDVAADSSADHDYANVATCMFLNSVQFTASGAAKADIQADVGAGLVTKSTIIIPAQGGSQQFDFDPPIECTGPTAVRIIMYNREGSAQSLYSTIIGVNT